MSKRAVEFLSGDIMSAHWDTGEADVATLEVQPKKRTRMNGDPDKKTEIGEGCVGLTKTGQFTCVQNCVTGEGPVCKTKPEEK